MLCENCGKNEATVMYTEIINGVKKQMSICEECSKEMKIGIDFSLPIDSLNFLGDFLERHYETMEMPNIASPGRLVCPVCKMTYNDFALNPEFGCASCYDVFQEIVDPLLKYVQGANRHIGRAGNPVSTSEVGNLEEKKPKEENELQKLKRELNKMIKEEAAVIRDKIKEIEGGKKC